MLCVSQNAFHGSLSCSLHNLLDVIIFGLLQRKEIEQVHTKLNVLSPAQRDKAFLSVTPNSTKKKQEKNTLKGGGGVAMNISIA